MTRPTVLAALVMAVMVGASVPASEGGGSHAVYRMQVGETLVNPTIDCDADPTAAIGNAIGIVVDASDTTIINPEIRECDQGIVVRKKNGVMPTHVRIIASDDHAGYRDTTLTLNRTAVAWRAGNGVVGDVSVRPKHVGGQLSFSDNYRDFSGTLTTHFRMHHTSSTCVIPCPRFSNADSPGAVSGLKFIADRTQGPPYEASHVRFDHNFVQGFDDEGISFDPRGDTPALRLAYGSGSVTAVSANANIVTVPNISADHSTIGMFVIFTEGRARGASLPIVSRSGSVFTLDDPAHVLSRVEAGTRVTIGGRFFDNRVDHNVIDAFHDTAAKSGFNTAGQLFSRITSNLVYDTPSFPYTDAFNLRTDHQCIMVRSAAGPAPLPDFSFFNTIRGNTCDDAGDISAVIVSWGTYEVASPTCIGGNTFTGSLRGQVWRHEAPSPGRGAKACRQRGRRLGLL